MTQESEGGSLLTICECGVMQGDSDIEKLVSSGGEEHLFGRLSDAVDATIYMISEQPSSIS